MAKKVEVKKEGPADKLAKVIAITLMCGVGGTGTAVAAFGALITLGKVVNFFTFDFHSHNDPEPLFFMLGVLATLSMAAIVGTCHWLLSDDVTKPANGG